MTRNFPSHVSFALWLLRFHSVTSRFGCPFPLALHFTFYLFLYFLYNNKGAMKFVSSVLFKQWVKEMGHLVFPAFSGITLAVWSMRGNFPCHFGAGFFFPRFLPGQSILIPCARRSGGGDIYIFFILALFWGSYFRLKFIILILVKY